MKFFVRTLGCKMNWLDSARISGALQGVGHHLVSHEEEADVIFVNSCTVTSEADRKSRQISKSAARSNKQIAIMGCGPKVDFERWERAIPSADIFQDDTALYHQFGIEDEQALFPLRSRTRLPVAIQQGCDNQCTFCITRIARGAHSNVPLAQVIDQVNMAQEHGVKEIVLTGINLAAWGCSDSNRAQESRFAQLLESLLAKTSIPRIRISSVGPQYLNDAFFDVFSDPRICDHLHLSIQSGSVEIVKRMVRGHSIDEVIRAANDARKRRADVALSCDLIVGFPGESEKHFEETMELAASVRFAKLHVFPYSVREGTPAAGFPGQVPMAERKARAAQLRSLGSELRNAFLHQQLGKTRAILVESNGFGHTGNYIRVKAPLAASEGEIVDVQLNPDNIQSR